MIIQKKKLLFPIGIIVVMFMFMCIGNKPINRDKGYYQKGSIIEKKTYEEYGSDITSGAPYQIPGIKIYRKPVNLAKDPVTYLQIIVVEPDNVYKEMVEALKFVNFIPKSEQEAINVAKLIIYADDEGIKIYPNLGRYSGVENNYNVSISSPIATKQDYYYEVILYATMAGRGNFIKSYGLQKYIINIGKDRYEMIRENFPEKNE